MNDVLGFIKNYISKRRILWTYHVNMRLKQRFISREDIISSIDNYEIIEEYPEDRDLPSYLIYSQINEKKFHMLIAVDFSDEYVTIITSYEPTLDKWEEGFKIRRRK